ncbi:MAG: hypothetical protein MMC23_006792 [Stictis urceolatum]|nr:hypothetical protein [Stictis urceolata]
MNYASQFYSSNPDISVVCHAIAVDPGEDEFDLKSVPKKATLRSWFFGLVSLSSPDLGGALSFSHSTVREYLSKSERDLDPESRNFAINPFKAIPYVQDVLLTYLCSTVVSHDPMDVAGCSLNGQSDLLQYLDGQYPFYA